MPLFVDRFEGETMAYSEVRTYDITPDGQRFLMVEPEEESLPTELIVVVNWFESF